MILCVVTNLFSTPSRADEEGSTTNSFDHSGGKARPHSLSGFIITSTTHHKRTKKSSAEAALTHCFPAQLHDGFYLIKSAAWLSSINATSAVELCGSQLLDQTEASIGILQVRPAQQATSVEGHSLEKSASTLFCKIDMSSSYLLFRSSWILF